MRGAWRQEEGESVVEAAGILPRQPACGIELVGRNLRRWVDRGEQRLDRERRRVTCRRVTTPRAGLPRRGTQTTWPTAMESCTWAGME